MLKYLSQKWQKKIALLLYMLFYLQFIGYAYEYRKYSNQSGLYYTSASQSGYNGNDNLRSIAHPFSEKGQANTDHAIPPVLLGNNKESGRSAYAASPLFGGPGQPEMSTFKAAGADNMVNLFTGDFSYNIPLLDVGGYPVNIFYNAGITMDQEASWVGLGWNINPGTISRNMRGLPDDFDGSAADGDKVIKQQSVKKDLTIGVDIGGNVELTGSPAGIPAHAGIFWNNKRGLGLEVGADFSVQQSLSAKSGTDKTENDTGVSKTLSADLALNLNSQNGLSARANAGFEKQVEGHELSLLNGLSTTVDYNSRQGINSIQIEAESNLYTKFRTSSSILSAWLPSRLGTTISFARSSFTPAIRMPMSRFNGNLKIKAGSEGIVVFPNGFIAGSLSKTYIADDDKTQIRPAFGYINYEKAKDNSDALLDFNRLNDGTFTLKTPVISVPNYTYDVFSINGEGTGGSFRAYRGNMGFVRDNKTVSREGAFSLTLDVGPGFIFHGGTEIGGVYSKTEVGDWVKSNIMRDNIAFNGSHDIYQAAYFKNPGEKAIIDEDYYNSVGADQLVRPKLTSIGLPSSGGTFPLPKGIALPQVASRFEVFDANKRYSGEDKILTADNTYRKKRDKRTQIITWLTAEEAERVGLDKSIYSYPENDFDLNNKCNAKITPIRRFNNVYRKAHHLSEIDVLEGDGKRYVYGLPAYSISQKDVSFSIDNSQVTTSTHTKQEVSYTAGTQNSVNNNSGRDGFFQSETVPAYAHSFLLTGILSPDYVDVTGDGISDDDIGTAVKFNYTRVNKYPGINQWENQKWRTPMSPLTAHYNEGLKTDNADDKALYTYGEKELWYTHSIESKNMIATFTLADRYDGKRANGEDGGINGNNGQRKLQRIDLYTKAEFLKKSATYTPRPVKTVHFEYSYVLCNHSANNINDGGKLTLESLWFSYNGNYKQTYNKYRFKYAADRNDDNGALIPGNQDYNSTQSDRWGTFKKNVANPAGMANADFPFTLQGSNNVTKNNIYASTWNLEKIQIPSGAVINVSYEADDYAFVQNKRAAQMTKIIGFTKDKNSTPDNKLYEFNLKDFLNPGNMDKNCVIFEADEPLRDESDILHKYLVGVNQILMKLWVEMPHNNYSTNSDYEPVNIYANIAKVDGYGIVPGTNNANKKLFYVNLKPSSTGGSPIMETIMQFLKDYLPSKAFKGYDDGNEPAFQQLVSAVSALATNFSQAITGFENNLKSGHKCQQVDLDRCYARLNNPMLKKMGGGHRVKSVILSDNWKKMINPLAPISTQLDSYYGQVYDYTTKDTLNGDEHIISSGVASYEPGIGNEENPFREVLQYSEHQPLGPTNVNNIELPVTETFFPSPSVGYSKVTVRSIHNKDNKKIKSNTGLTETRFYTSKDFPVFSDYTDFDARSRVHYKPGPIMKFLFRQNKDFLTLSQGFRIMLNDMNGKMRSQSVYAENDFKNPINYTEYIYRLENRSIDTPRLDNHLDVINDPAGVVSNKLVGREVEVMNDFREHRSVTRSAQIPLNVEAFAAGPIPILLPSIFNAVFADVSMFRSATTLKVITDYGIVDSIVNIDKGSVVSTKNMIYDGETGEVLVSRTNNSFNKPVYNLSYPAHWVNSGMGLAFNNIDVTYKDVKFIRGEIKNLPPAEMNNFESGDEIYVVDQSTDLLRNTQPCINLGEQDNLPLSDQFKIWALDVAKDDRNLPNHKFIFIDRYGNPYNSSAAGATIRIIRSGKRNMGNIAVGGITSLKNPIVKGTDNREKITVDINSKVLNATAAEFREKWRVQDAFYSADTSVQIVQYVPVRTKDLKSRLGHTISRYMVSTSWPSGQAEYQDWNLYNPEFFMAQQHSEGNSRRDKRKQVKSWLIFDGTNPQTSPGISLLPSTCVIKSAKLELFSHSLGPGNFSILDHNFLYHNSHFPNRNNTNPLHLKYDGGHTDNNPLYTRSPSLFENNFKISRMLGTWPVGFNDPTPNAGGDVNFDGNESQGYYNQVEVSAPAYYSARASYSDISNSTFGAIDVKGIVEGMIRDYHDPAKHWSPAMKISMLTPLEYQAHDSWVCFFGSNKNIKIKQTQIHPGMPPVIDYVNPLTPFIHIKYFDCSEALPPESPRPTTYEYDSCTHTQNGLQCFSVFNQQLMNPYVYGVLGNWRPWRSYVYYGDRTETNPRSATNIATDGTLKDFENYWIPATASSGYLQRTGSAKWVWNSEINQYNRKGAEIENHDPLNRYNSGVYGYHETLPIAVANNARVREIAYDGFEDYGYKDELCTVTCNPYKRHFRTGDAESLLSTDVHHSGRYSLKIPVGGTANNFTITTNILPNDLVSTPDMRIRTDGVTFTDTSFTPAGSGKFTRTQYDGLLFGWENAVQPAPLPNPYFPLVNESSTGLFSSKWEGKLQPFESGVYHFDLGGINLMYMGKLYINNQLINNQLIYSGWWHGVTDISNSIILKRGEIYSIKILYNQNGGRAFMQLRWNKEGSTTGFTAVPRLYLYDNYHTPPHPTNPPSTCMKPDIIRPLEHKLIDSFCLIPGKHYVLSAWVREGTGNCESNSYLHNSIALKINGDPWQPPGAPVEFAPSGNIIEGWQRYEFDFTLPESNVQNFGITFKNTSGQPAYFDDLRISPYNSNIKTFVYDPVTLRLSAELDENNYATFYEYDDEGTLVRVKKETIKGVKTIQETRSGLQRSLYDF